MVGVPHSAGCRTCLKRKVRCDQAKPCCQRCQNSGRQCAGYRNSFQFITSKHQPSSSNSTDLDLRRPNGYHETINYNVFGIQDIMPFFLGFVETDVGNSDHLILRRYVDDKALHHSDMVGNCYHALKVALCAKHHNLTRAKDYGRVLYTECVGKVQSALYDPLYFLENDTLACILLLAVCEIVTFTVGSATMWQTHISGAVTLMRLRGSPRHRPIPRELYDTFRVFVILKASILGKRTFLEQEEWKNRSSDVYSQLLNLMSEVPGVIEDRNKLVKRSHADFSDHNAKAFNLYQRMVTWREGIHIEFDLVPGEEDDEVFPIVRDFPEPYPPIRQTNLFCASMIHLVDCLPPKQVDELYRTEVLCDCICLSVKCIKKSIEGRHTLIFPLSIAAYHLHGKQRIWAFSQLRQLGLSDFDLAISVSGGENGPYPSEVAPVLSPQDGHQENFEELI